MKIQMGRQLVRGNVAQLCWHLLLGVSRGTATIASTFLIAVRW